MKKRRMATEASPPGKTERIFLRTLMGLALVSAVTWGILASLIAWHLQQRKKVLKEELIDQREMFSEMKAADEAERRLLAEEIVHLEMLRQQVDRLLDMMVRDESPPDNIFKVLDTINNMVGMLDGEHLDQTQIRAMQARLELLMNVKATDAPGMLRVLELLAAEGAISSREVPEWLDRIERKLHQARNIEKPPAVGTPSGPGSGPPVVVKAPPKPAAKGIPYHNARYRFRMTFPEGWTVKAKEVENGVQALSPGLGDGLADRGYVVVTASEILVAGILRDYELRQLEELKAANPGLELLGQSDLEIQGVRARLALCRMDKLGKPFQSLQVVAIHRGFGYVLSFSARADLYPQLQETFQQVLESFTFE